MDSKRVLSGTLITVSAFTAIGTTTARAESAPPVVKLRTWTTSAQPKITAMAPSTRNKRIALGQVVQRSWNLREFRCLDNLWTRESGWNHRALNRSSGAYGIPQSLPAVKMSSAGRDWKSNPETQIRWGLAYIKGRYGRPCGAWGHWRSHNWY
ncbi:lytic transglycosylase domain-containing protein [Nonomuraea purpurea]|uniref:Lytic transglycosylase domain-containing protein n=1 Tax=Nonomuraea purpurea TaxID=1849276 RepID=A0ABV8G7S5_9ACTN